MMIVLEDAVMCIVYESSVWVQKRASYKYFNFAQTELPFLWLEIVGIMWGMDEEVFIRFGAY